MQKRLSVQQNWCVAYAGGLGRTGQFWQLQCVLRTHFEKRLSRTRKWSNAFTAKERREKSLYRPFAYLTNYKWNISQIKAIMIGRSSRVGCSSQLGFWNLEKKNNKQENKLQRELKGQNALTFGLNSVSQLGRKTNTNNNNNIWQTFLSADLAGNGGEVSKSKDLPRESSTPVKRTPISIQFTMDKYCPIFHLHKNCLPFFFSSF